MSELMVEIIQEYRDKINLLESENKQINSKLREYENKFGKYNKEESQLMLKIQEVKNILLENDISKSGFNSHNKYNYFELEDLTPVIVPALLSKKLASKFYMNNDKMCLQIVDTETGAWDQVSTKLKVYHRDDVPRGDLTYLMKYEQAAQTYARRTLWLIMLDITEHVPEESETTVKNKTKKSYGFKLPENVDANTKAIFDKIKKDFGNKVEFNHTTIKNKLSSMLKSKQIDETMYKNCIKLLD